MQSTDSFKAIDKLTNAITSLDTKVDRLTARLTGDAALQTNGLIGDLAEVRKELNAVHELERNSRDRLEAIEKQNAEQAGLLEDLRTIRILTDNAWKVVGLFIGAGLLNPLITAWFTHFFGHPK
jgi:hypothetical protein